ncbi:glycosyltransferase [Edwardsiella tarda]|uniref:glycosyltransferase n=1 Tax=Edwardsiella tarda TaxID=636 RepID=UPI003F65A544
MKRIIFVQPAIPKYRVPFFSRLNKNHDICIYTTKVDFLGVKTVYEHEHCNTLPGFICLFKGKVLWMKKLPLFSGYRKNDIVVINGNPRIINYMLLFLILKIKRVKTVWWGHGWSAGSHGMSSKIRLHIMRFLSSNYLFYTDKEKEKIGIKNSYALNNGLDSSVYKQEISKLKYQRNSPIKEGVLRLLYIGRITEKSNFSLLLTSLSLCNKNVILTVVGSCNNIEDYISLSKRLGVSKQIIWLGELFDDEKITRVMLSNHVFIYAGSVGLSLIHAFNYGLPALLHSSSEHHMPEFAAFKDGFNGFCFEMNNAKSIADAINHFSYLSDEEYFELEKNAYKTVEIDFNMDKMINNFNSMIERIS